MAAIKQSGIDLGKVPSQLWKRSIANLSRLMLEDGLQEFDIKQTKINVSYDFQYRANVLTVYVITDHRTYHIDFMYEEP